MRHLICITFILTAICGCSGTSPTNPSDVETINLSTFSAATSNQWIWGNYFISISPDRNTAEILPQRASLYHLNVTPFVEEAPCSNCLWLGKVNALPDGTVKLKINLRHPFYGHPIYTGFDVRGICMFKATDYLVFKFGGLHTAYGAGIASGNVPIYYSDPLKGGAALLNADGYTYTLNPMINMKGSKENKLLDLPIFDYSKAKHAYGDVDTAVNPYKLFSDTSPRRMFKHNDLFTRTYHIKPPEDSGPFEFGYVVSACWAPPLKTPVTNPEADFPLTANCEDAYEISIVQLTPVTPDNYINMDPIFRAIIHHRKDQKPTWCHIISSTFLKSNSTGLPTEDCNCFIYPPHPPKSYPNDIIEINEQTTQLIFRGNEDTACEAFSVVPGWHLGILVSIGQKQFPTPGVQFSRPWSVHPVMIYVQE